MHNVLVTGATGFLGHHVVTRLTSAGVQPRVLDPHAADAGALRAACEGADLLLHLAFKVSVGGGPALADEMQRVNVEGTRDLLRAAAAAGVRRAVVVGSALAVGVNREPVPLDEGASWDRHALSLPYAAIRRTAEQAALAEATPRFDVLVVSPSFTFGPDDPVGAPGNKLLDAIVRRKLPFTLPVGFSCLDVRDFADGMVRAGERGRSGERYLLGGENVTATELLERVGRIAGVRVPRFTPPLVLLRLGVAAVGALSRLRRTPPPVSPDVLEILNRYAWYDTAKARRELGWTPRPLDVTLTDTVAWLRESRQRGETSRVQPT